MELLCQTLQIGESQAEALLGSASLDDTTLPAPGEVPAIVATEVSMEVCEAASIALVARSLGLLEAEARELILGDTERRQQQHAIYSSTVAMSDNVEDLARALSSELAVSEDEARSLLMDEETALVLDATAGTGARSIASCASPPEGKQLSPTAAQAHGRAPPLLLSAAGGPQQPPAEAETTSGAEVVDEMHEAARRGELHTVEHLLALHGEDGANAEDGLGATPLWHACSAVPSQAAAQVASALLQAKANVHHCAPSGDLALHACAREHALETMKILLAHGADVNAMGHVKYSPLKAAITGPIYRSSRSHADAVALLLGAAADPNATNPASTTHSDPPLSIAARCGRLDVVGLLLDAGADVRHRDAHSGRTALDHARAIKGSNGDVSAITRLLEDANQTAR